MAHSAATYFRAAGEEDLFGGGLGFHRRGFMGVAGFVIGGPFPNLVSIVEMAGS